MFKRLLRAAVALVVFLALTAPVAAQAPPAEPAASLSPPAAAEKPGPNPVPALTIAFVCTVLILFIICRPARKL
jgi:hypothetical protein